jgi:hypothetical protein
MKIMTKKGQTCSLICSTLETKPLINKKIHQMIKKNCLLLMYLWQQEEVLEKLWIYFNQAVKFLFPVVNLLISKIMEWCLEKLKKWIRMIHFNKSLINILRLEDNLEQSLFFSLECQQELNWVLGIKIR